MTTTTNTAARLISVASAALLTFVMLAGVNQLASADAAQPQLAKSTVGVAGKA